MKRKQVFPPSRKARLLSALIAVACFGGAACASASPSHVDRFRHMVVFGDSFSDGGNFAAALGVPLTRFTTNPGHVAVENIAAYLGLPLDASANGGSNYAFAYASMRDNMPDTPPFVNSLYAQLDAYLAAHGGKADPDALFTLVGGANDVFMNFAMVADGVLDMDTALANLAATATDELEMIARLRAAGARYVMVFNLPDLGLSPDVVAAGPEAAGLLTALTAAYNAALDPGLQASGVNIVPVDLFRFMDELAANPARYGLTDTTTPACGEGSDAFACGPEGSGATYTYAPGAERTHMFADFGHPSSATHQMIGEYAASILAAPGQHSLLGVAPLAVHESMRRGIFAQTQMRFFDTTRAPRFWFAHDYIDQSLGAQANAPGAKQRGNLFSLGADLRPTEHFIVGLALGGGRTRVSLEAESGAFRLEDRLANAYAGWVWPRAYLVANLSRATLDFRDVTRSFAIGAALRGERGASSGREHAGALEAGWRFGDEEWSHGPYLRLERQRVRVDAYRETGATASTMRFGALRVDSDTTTLGWQLQGRIQSGAATWHPFAGIAHTREERAAPIEAGAGLVTMQGFFTLPGHALDRGSSRVDLGVRADFSQSVSAWIAAGSQFGGSSRSDRTIGVGLSLHL